MRILSVDGGGYLGLASASFLSSLENHFQTRCHERFDLFCGTSVGAIIVLALAAGKTGHEVVELFDRMGKVVFDNRVPLSRAARWIRGFFASRYSNEGLKLVLKETFEDLKLGDLKANNKVVLVTAFCVSSGTPRVFKTDHSTKLTRDDGYLVRDLALASAAAPIYFPLVELESPKEGLKELFCDGGVFANHPAVLAYAEAIFELKKKPSEISLLSVSTPRADLGEYDSSRTWLQRLAGVQRFLVKRGLILWSGKLAQVFIDSTAMSLDQVLRRIISSEPGEGAKYERVVLKKPLGLDMDVATPEATRTLKQVGIHEAVQNDMRDRLKVFFEKEESGNGKSAKIL